MSDTRIHRRNFLATGSPALAACSAVDGEYFGRTTPPSSQRLIFGNGFEPETLDPALQMKRLSDCERSLLRGMPFIPFYFDTWVYLERPEVHGLKLSPLGVPAFKYA
jgi:hypothetical protein